MTTQTQENSKTTGRGRFRDQIIAVTGAGSGIGLATAQAFAQEGGSVFLIGRSATVRNACDKMQAQGLPAQCFVGDMSQEDFAKIMTESCLKHFGRMDVLVNAAGILRSGAIEQIDGNAWNEMLAHNLTNAFFCCRFAVEVMKRQGGGSIVNVSSLAGRFRSGLGGVHYAASKAAVIGLTRQLAYEVAPCKIRVNAVCPGPTMTPMLAGNLKEKQKDPATISQIVPLGYVSHPKEQAQAILFLASQESSYMTGAIIDVNGGLY